MSPISNLKWCIDYLKEYNQIKQNLPYNFTVFRGLLNITMPYDLSDEFYIKQDLVLNELLSKRDIYETSNLKDGICLYKGDITQVKADAIVNACNSKLLGCFIPGHHCIDNAIHSFAGLEVRRDLLKIMEEQGHDEENGKCKVTRAYNLPSKFIFHTVGPIYSGIEKDEMDLSNCYFSCLKKADELKLESIVFCSLSTGIFGYPIEEASKIAIKTVRSYLEKENKNIKKVIFNLFSDGDYDVYKRKLNKIN